MARLIKEKLIDFLLTIYLINDTFLRKKLARLSETKLQKLVFLSEKEMIDEGKKGFSYYFIKLDYGPFSSELRHMLGVLIQTRIINEELKPRNDAELILEDFQDVIERNQVFFEKINAVNDSFARMQLSKLLRKIYAMPWTTGGAKIIGNLPPRAKMLYPMKPEKVKVEFQITDEELEDLLANIDPASLKTLSQAMKDMRSGRLLTRGQVFSKI